MESPLSMTTIESSPYKNKHKRYWAVALALLICVPLWLLFVVPSLTKLSSDFSYSADIISLDNFYDEEHMEYSGEQRSVTRFSYEKVEDKEVSLILSNIFEVRTVTGDPIFSVARKYGINPVTREHVPGTGDRDREGYLFAPRHLKKGEPFTYWHINYDGPASMSFVGEEVIAGVKVFRYESHYTGVKIDQTENLGFLPEVGKTRGVELEPYLQLWVEPVTGHLVKYKDETTAYYYNLHSGARLTPWNKFSNSYQRSSVTKQALIARQQKVIYRTIEFVIPLTMILLSVTLLLWRDKKRIAVLLLSIGLISLGGYIASFYLTSSNNIITVGISRYVPSGNTLYDDNIQGFKDGLSQAGLIEGKDIKYVIETANADDHRQKAIAKKFVDQEVDLIYSLTTPGTLIIKEMVTDLPVVYSFSAYPVEVGLIDSLKTSGNNLVGTRNWVAIDEQLSIFREIVPMVSMIGFVHSSGELNSTIQFEEMRSLAATLGVEVVEIAGENLSGLTEALEKTPLNLDAIYSPCDTLVQSEAEDTIIKFAQERKIPSFSCNLSGVEKGNLLSVGADTYQIGKLSGEKAALILEGVTPSSLSTETVARPFIIINLKTANYLNIEIPQAILLKATSIVQ
jgi:putative tryptophan/tyrosine transport system substrate-binding protein